MPGGSMPNRLERLLEKKGGLVELILSLIFVFTGIIGTSINLTYEYANIVLGLHVPNIGVLHSLAFLAIMVVFIFIGMALIIDFLLKAF
jgi:hypothetical protein